MIVNDQLKKLNKFQYVSIPTPAEYVKRFGFQTKPQLYTDDDIAPNAISKLDSLAQIARENTMHLREEYARSQQTAAPVEPQSIEGSSNVQ